MQPESAFKFKLKKELERRIPGCLIFVNDPQLSFQGAPDILVLYKDRWAALEAKRSASAPYRPNQEYYIHLMDDWSFARMVCPENVEEVLDAVQRALLA